MGILNKITTGRFDANFICSSEADRHVSTETLNLLIEERIKQRKKFGNEPLADAQAALRICMEELGEAAAAKNQRLPDKCFNKEILQLAAVCIAYLDGDLHDGEQA